MKQGIKRPISAYMLQALYIAIPIFLSTINSLESWKWYFRACGLIYLIPLIQMIVKPNYFEIAGNKLFINRFFSRARIIDLNQIEKFEIEPSPFTSSKIVLKDKAIVDYQDSQTDDNELKKLMGQFNILVD